MKIIRSKRTIPNIYIYIDIYIYYFDMHTSSYEEIRVLTSGSDFAGPTVSEYSQVNSKLA